MTSCFLIKCSAK
uniref:Uncharacterized protein n=1 Tax=Anguilla anguilla TaxID=7936 RepID=A0A0E9VFD3_ANGAN